MTMENPAQGCPRCGGGSFPCACAEELLDKDGPFDEAYLLHMAHVLRKTAYKLDGSTPLRGSRRAHVSELMARVSEVFDAMAQRRSASAA